MTTSANDFAAVDPALGYLYQCRVGLWWALERLRRNDAVFHVSVEVIDDVAFEDVAGPTDALQTKHGMNNKADVSDMSVDLWKTLRAWMEGRAAGRLPPTCLLYLVTTASAAKGSAAAKLRSANRDPDGAEILLSSAASKSKNATTKGARSAFLLLSTSQRRALLNQVVVLDTAGNISALSTEIGKALRFATEPQLLPAFQTRLESWWLRRVLDQLIAAASGSSSSISSDELQERIDNLRNQFRRESLPIDDEVLDIDANEALISAHNGNCFVKQAELIGLGSRQIAYAVRDYARAYVQRSRWLRDNLIGTPELSKYERRLIEEWERHFAKMEDSVDEDTLEAEKCKLATSLYNWIEEEAGLRVRRDVDELFVTRGSYQMLADSRRVGWHPEFRNRLDALLSVAVTQ